MSSVSRRAITWLATLALLMGCWWPWLTGGTASRADLWSAVLSINYHSHPKDFPRLLHYYRPLELKRAVDILDRDESPRMERLLRRRFAIVKLIGGAELVRDGRRVIRLEPPELYDAVRRLAGTRVLSALLAALDTLGDEPSIPDKECVAQDVLTQSDEFETECVPVVLSNPPAEVDSQKRVRGQYTAEVNRSFEALTRVTDPQSWDECPQTNILLSGVADLASSTPPNDPTCPDVPLGASYTKASSWKDALFEHYRLPESAGGGEVKNVLCIRSTPADKLYTMDYGLHENTCTKLPGFDIHLDVDCGRATVNDLGGQNILTTGIKWIRFDDPSTTDLVKLLYDGWFAEEIAVGLCCGASADQALAPPASCADSSIGGSSGIAPAPRTETSDPAYCIKDLKETCP